MNVLETGYHLSEGVNLATAANVMNIQVKDGGMYEIKPKDIRTCSNACI